MVCRFDITSEFWFRHDHLNSEQLLALADGTLDSESKEIIDVHLKSCTTCREDVASFLKFRNERHGSLKQAWSGPNFLPRGSEVVLFERNFAWNSRYAIAALLLVTFAIFSAIVIVLNKPHSTGVPKRSGPEGIATITPTDFPSPVDSKSPTVVQDDRGLIAILHDGPNKLAIYNSGRIDGLDRISSTTRQEVSQALLTGKVETAAVLKDLVPKETTLRGPDNSETTFNLLYPLRQVLIEARPEFRWQALKGASSYQVYVMDSQNTQVAKSELLPSTELMWVPKHSLPGGKALSWAVTAVLDGQEVVSPSASEPEMKFAVISESDKQELNDLSRSESPLARGVFFARTGLLTQAQAEFKKLIKLNPESPLPRKLLRSVQKTESDQ